MLTLLCTSGAFWGHETKGFQFTSILFQAISFVWQHICLLAFTIMIIHDLDKRKPANFEMKMLGYLFVIIGIVSLSHSWMNIVVGTAGIKEIIYLALGLLLNLWGIGIILKNQKHKNS
jgi:hypothetical protein